MRCGDQQPVRPAGTRPQIEERRQEPGEELGPVLAADSEEIDRHALGGGVEKLNNLAHGRSSLRVSEGRGRSDALEVALGIEDAELIIEIAQLLQEAGCQSRLSA